MQKSKLLTLLVGVSVVAAMLVLPACSKPAPAPAPTTAAPAPTTSAPAPAPTTAAPKPVELKAVTWVTQTHTDFWEFKTFQQLLTEKSKGLITIKYLGGNEVIPQAELDTAVKNGVIDLSFPYASGVTDTIPGVELLYGSTVEPAKEEGFINDVLRPTAEKVGIYFAGRWQISNGYYLMYTNKKVTQRSDFNGQKIAAAGWVSQALVPLGVTPVSIPVADYYTAAQTGTIDGLIRSPGGAVEFKLWEVLKYAIDYPISSAAGVMLLNLKTWNSLSPDMQKAFMDAQKELLVKSAAYQSGIFGDARKKAIDNGLIPLKFADPADGDWYVQSFMDGAWAYFGKTYPDLVAKYKTTFVPAK